MYPDSIIGCQGVRRTRKLCSAQQSAITRSRMPCFHRRIQSFTMRQRLTLLLTCSIRKPTGCLEVISLVASSCGYNRGEIEQRVAQEFTAHVTTQKELAERPQERHPPRAQPVAPMWECHGGVHG